MAFELRNVKFSIEIESISSNDEVAMKKIELTEMVFALLSDLKKDFERQAERDNNQDNKQEASNGE